MKLFTEVSMLFLGALSVVRTQHTQYVIPFVDYNMTLTGSDYGMPINVTIFFQLTDPDMVKPTINCTATINAYAINMPYFRPCEDPTIAFHFETSAGGNETTLLLAFDDGNAMIYLSDTPRKYVNCYTTGKKGYNCHIERPSCPFLRYCSTERSAVSNFTASSNMAISRRRRPRDMQAPPTQYPPFEIREFYIYEFPNHFTKTLGSWLSFMVIDRMGGTQQEVFCDLGDYKLSIPDPEQWFKNCHVPEFTVRIHNWKWLNDFELDIKHEFEERSTVDTSSSGPKEKITLIARKQIQMSDLNCTGLPPHYAIPECRRLLTPMLMPDVSRV